MVGLDGLRERLETTAVTVNRAVIGVLACFGLLAGCSDDDGSSSRRPSSAGRDAPSGPAAELAERIGCSSSEPGPSGHLAGAETRSCVVDGEWPANVHAGLTPPQRAAAIRLLGYRYEPDFCVDGSFEDIVVVAGETWIVVVANDAAERVVDRIGGAIQPGRPGPPISYNQPDGGFCRR